jgi:hypothetical protein
MDDAQAKLLAHVLEFYSRFGIGQLEDTAEEFNRLFGKPGRPFDPDNNPALALLSELKRQELGFSANASYGIGAPDVHDNVKDAYNLMHVLQQAIAKHEGHPDFSVWHRGTLELETGQPDATCEVTK